MQTCPTDGKALTIHRLLGEHYGEPQLKTQRDPLSELIVTILSQNTSDTNSGRAYQSLKSRFPRWEDVLDAGAEELSDAIRVGGLANVKAPRIMRILRMLQETRGGLDLSFLDTMELEESREYLLALPGVGPKTAACVLLFSLHKPALPVDTHVHRVSRRVGLVPEKASAEKTHQLLEDALPPDTYYPFHLNMIHHGRIVCHSQRPKCAECVLRPECVHVRSLEADQAVKDAS